MKKIQLLSIILVISLLFCSCQNPSRRIEGIEYFFDGESEFEINVWILPSDDFLERFDYTNAEYCFDVKYKHYLSMLGNERSLIAINYEQSSYEDAKAFCLQEMVLSDSNRVEYNGYTFIENIRIAKDPTGNSYSSQFPQYYNMFAYNDNLQCLIFIGRYDLQMDHSVTAQDILSNWGEYLNEQFSDIYSF